MPPRKRRTVKKSRDALARGRIIHKHPPKYVVKWHRVQEWAYAQLDGLDITSADHPDIMRVAGWRGALVADIDNDEEAAEAGEHLESGRDFDLGPSRDLGGTRRVAIRAYTWEWDPDVQHAFNPQWITTGFGMSATSAVKAHRRYIRDYEKLVGLGRASRLLIVTQWEIVWWTAPPTVWGKRETDYV